ncbi:MAG: DUF7689 domain-containing protein [Fimbriiglobus sp.]
MNPLELAFPGLIASGYRPTSPPDDGYNCIAWAAGEADRWWWPDPFGVSFWPPGVPRAESVEAFVAAYTTLGFRPSASTASGWQTSSVPDPHGAG